MSCEQVNYGNGVTGWVCTRGQRRPRCGVEGCTNPAERVCDFPLGGRKTGQTCDRRLCAGHAHRHGPDVDYCPAHERVAAAAQLALPGQER